MSNSHARVTAIHFPRGVHLPVFKVATANGHCFPVVAKELIDYCRRGVLAKSSDDVR
jgi:hypothetical protein